MSFAPASGKREEKVENHSSLKKDYRVTQDMSTVTQESVVDDNRFNTAFVCAL